MAVGGKSGTGEPPTGRQWELLTTTNATNRGTHKNGRIDNRHAGLARPVGCRRLGARLLAHHAHGAISRLRSSSGEKGAGSGPERPTKPDWIGSGVIRRKTSRSLAIFCRRARAVARARHGMGWSGFTLHPLPCYRFDSLRRSVGEGLGANEAPIGIGAKPLARYPSKALDGWAALCRHLALTIAPKARSLGRNANGSGKPGHAGKSGDGLLNCIHVQNSTLVDHINLQVCL
jgi:hypothetical protein